MNRSGVMKKAMDDHWMENAVKKPGSFTRTAKRAGKSVHAEAEAKKSAGGITGKRARLAIAFEKAKH